MHVTRENITSTLMRCYMKPGERSCNDYKLKMLEEMLPETMTAQQAESLLHRLLKRCKFEPSIAEVMEEWYAIVRENRRPQVFQAGPAQTVPQRRTAAYRATLEEDAELLKIFERTYGPIKRDPLAAFRPVQKRERPDFDAQQWEILPEYLLVDGYNIIFAWDELNALAKDSLEAARHKLMDILCNYQGYQKCNLILVFDAYRVPGSPGSIEQYHNIHVVYTREAETADMFIERVTHEIGKGRRVRVATSDGMEQVIILGHGALRVSARMFHEEVQEAEKEIRRYLQGEG